MQEFLQAVSHADERSLPGFVFGASSQPDYVQHHLGRMLIPLRAPNAAQNLAVKAVHQSGRFTLAIVHLPWPRGTEPPGDWPVITCIENAQPRIVGYVLPFNEIMASFSPDDQADIMELFGHLDGPFHPVVNLMTCVTG